MLSWRPVVCTGRFLRMGGWRRGLVLLLLIGVALPAMAADGADPELRQALFHYQLMMSVSVLVGILSGITSIASGIALIRARKDTQRREVSFAQEFVPAAECRLRVKATDERIERLERELKEVREVAAAAAATAEDRAARIHQRLDTMEEKISEMPSKLVALLKNTGAIK